MLVCVTVGDGLFVGVRVSVGLIVFDGLEVGEALGVAVGVAENVAVGVSVGEAVGVQVGEAVGVQV